MNKVLFGKFIIDAPACTVVVIDDEGEHHRVRLTPLEFKIFHFFVQNSGHIFSRKEVIRFCAGEGHNVTLRTVDTHICSIRKKLSVVNRMIIRTVYGKGYVFNSHHLT